MRDVMQKRMIRIQPAQMKASYIDIFRRKYRANMYIHKEVLTKKRPTPFGIGQVGMVLALINEHNLIS